VQDKSSHSILFPKELLKIIKIRAMTQERSVSAEVIYLLKRALDQTDNYDKEALRILRTHELRHD
jgi:plasmid stability protein